MEINKGAQFYAGMGLRVLGDRLFAMADSGGFVWASGGHWAIIPWGLGTPNFLRSFGNS